MTHDSFQERSFFLPRIEHILTTPVKRYKKISMQISKNVYENHQFCCFDVHFLYLKYNSNFQPIL